MTLAVLTRTLDEELAALVIGEAWACLVCGEDVDVHDRRVECPACGSVLAEDDARERNQLAFL